MIIIRFKCFRVIGINRYWISCDGFNGEIILGDVGSGQGAAVAGVVGIEYCIHTKKFKFENIKLIFTLKIGTAKGAEPCDAVVFIICTLMLCIISSCQSLDS